MKRLLCAVVTLCALLSPAAAQMLSPKQGGFNEKLEFSKAFVAKNKIRSITLEAVKVFYSGKTAPTGLYDLYEFDKNGRLIKYSQVKQEDTTDYQEILYTEKGSMFRKIHLDKIYNKKYKSFYRCNSNQTLFREKSYEVLNRNEVMLMETRQYDYDEKENLTYITCLKNGKAVSTHAFEYDVYGRLVQECMYTSLGDTLRKVRYTYDSEDFLKKIKARENHEDEYFYSYDENRNLTAIKWHQNGSQKGEMTFMYNENGTLKTLYYFNGELSKRPQPKMCNIEYFEREG